MRRLGPARRFDELALLALRELLRGWPRAAPIDQARGRCTVLVLGLIVLLHAEDHGLLAGEPSLDESAREPERLLRRVHALLPSEGPPPRLRKGSLVRALLALRVHDGERVSYHQLEIEQIGAAYEAMLGFDVVRTEAGALDLVPGTARRRSGSHYTPLALAESSVATTLAPLLDSLGDAPSPAQILALEVCDPAMGSGVFLLAACRQLADALVRASPELEPLHARRLVATHCLHGVDKDPIAVGLAKLSLWLFSAATEPPSTFLDHALRCGDSLVGLSRAQIAAFDWRASDSDEASDAGHEGDARLVADALIAAFFVGQTTTQRERLRASHAALVQRCRAGDHEARVELEAIVEALRVDLGVTPLHWQLEFPEVFAQGGFRALVGNPPFLGGTRISSGAPKSYLAWLAARWGGGNRADLCAYFFRLAYASLAPRGCMGMIATNTIAQGDTRELGLAPILRAGGVIYAAQTRIKWRGAAVVHVSVVHLAKGLDPAKTLNGRSVARICAFLTTKGPDFSPRRLAANKSIAYEGVKPYGDGFLFEADKPKASPLARMHALLAEEPDNARCIFPFIGGEAINGAPDHAPSRYIIDFGARPEAEIAANWPELHAIVLAKVKPERMTKAADVAQRPWWQYWRPRRELFAAIAPLRSVLALSRHQHRWAVARLPTGLIYSEGVVVFAIDVASGFAILQSRVHELWARTFASTIKDDLRYTPTDCFETFPFPRDWRVDRELEAAGEAYLTVRAAAMVRRGEGLTKLYNRFHDPDQRDPDIVELRELHAAIDRAVLVAYGWHDLAERAACEFELEHARVEEHLRRKTKRPRARRLAWSQEFHDELLARLLELAARRADEDADADDATRSRGLPLASANG